MQDVESDDATRLADEVRSAAVVWQRELIRFVRTRTRILTSLVQPVLFLFVLGNGLSHLMGTPRARPAVGVHLTPLLVVEVIGAELLMAVALTAFGVVVASRISRWRVFR